LLASNLLSPVKLRDFFLQALELLIAFHAETGKVHADIKWENIVMDKAAGHLRLIDFEAAMDMGSQPEFHTAECKGTFNFAAPELFRGSLLGPVTAAADGFSLAASTASLVSNWNGFCEKLQSGLPASVRTERMGQGDHIGKLHNEINMALEAGKILPDLAHVLKALTQVRPEERVSLVAARNWLLRRQSN
jgi:serine/threonine protein kinase